MCLLCSLGGGYMGGNSINSFGFSTYLQIFLKKEHPGEGLLTLILPCCVIHPEDL